MSVSEPVSIFTVEPLAVLPNKPVLAGLPAAVASSASLMCKLLMVWQPPSKVPAKSVIGTQMWSSMSRSASRVTVVTSPNVPPFTCLANHARPLALLMVAGVLYAAHYHLGIWLIPLTWQNIAFLCGAVVLAAFVITFFSAVFAVNRYIRMKTADLYYV